MDVREAHCSPLSAPPSLECAREAELRRSSLGAGDRTPRQTQRGYAARLRTSSQRRRERTQRGSNPSQQRGTRASTGFEPQPTTQRAYLDGVLTPADSATHVPRRGSNPCRQRSTRPREGFDPLLTTRGPISEGFEPRRPPALAEMSCLRLGPLSFVARRSSAYGLVLTWDHRVSQRIRV
jgi:hypothetical protein